VPLRGGVTLVCRKAVPLLRLRIILRNARSVSVLEAQSELRFSMPVLSGEPVPSHRLGVILRSPVPGSVGDAALVLRRGETLLCKFLNSLEDRYFLRMA
jgi:hypothetical protein